MKTKATKAKVATDGEGAVRKFHHGHLREALLARLLEVLDLEGLEGIGVRRLARDLEVDPASVYRHFQDLRALHGAAREACFAAFALVMERAAQRSDGAADDASARAQWMRVGEAYVRYASGHPHRFRLMFGSRMGAASETRTEPAGPAWEVLLAVVKRGPSEDAMLDARMAWSLVHGVAALTTDGPFAGLGSADQKRVVRRALEVAADAMFKTEAKRR